MNNPPYGSSFTKTNNPWVMLKGRPNHMPDMFVYVEAGGTWFDHQTFIEWAGGQSPEITPPASNAKYDVVCLHRSGELRLISGTSSVSPQLPDLQWDYMPIVGIYIAAGVTKITSADIHDLRPVFTPYMLNSILEGQGLTAQYSVDGIAAWHGTWVVGDEYLRMEIGNAAGYTDPIKFVGTDGAAGIDGTDGTDGDDASIEYSIDGIGSWHGTWVGTDEYLRIQIGSGGWSSPMKFIGSDGTTGPDGAEGPQGPSGIGNAWHDGISNPSVGIGEDYDYYLNTSTGDIYKKNVFTYGASSIDGTGTASADTNDGSNVSSNAVDNNNTSYWQSASTALPHWIEYEFVSSKKIRRISIRSTALPAQCPDNFTLQASRSGDFTGEEIILLTVIGAAFTSNNTQIWTFDNENNFNYYRIYTSGVTGASTYVQLAEMEMYESTSSDWQLVGSLGSGGASGGIGGSGVCWHYGSINPTSITGEQDHYYLNTSTGDLFSRDTYTWSSELIQGVSGTESADGDDGSNPIANLVDNNVGTGWQSAASALPHWFQFQLTTAQAIQRISFYPLTGQEDDMPEDFTIWGSETGAFVGEQILLHTVTSHGTWTTAVWENIDFYNTTSYKYYRIIVTDTVDSGNDVAIAELRMYAISSTSWTIGSPVYQFGSNPSFTDLTDTPSSYVGEDGKFLVVDETGSEIDFIDPPSFLTLTDTPSTYTGQNQKALIVDETGNEIDFIDFPGSGTLFKGLGDPVSTLGVDDDWYIDQKTGNHWRKDGYSSSWSANLATNGTYAVSNSEDGGNIDDLAYDSTTGTYWQSITYISGYEWIGYDFQSGGEREIAKFMLQTSSLNIPGGVILEGTNDINADWNAKVWYQLSLPFNGIATTSHEIICDTTDSYRFYRIYSDSIVVGTQFRALEIEMYEYTGSNKLWTINTLGAQLSLKKSFLL